MSSQTMSLREVETATCAVCGRTDVTVNKVPNRKVLAIHGPPGQQACAGSKAEVRT